MAVPARADALRPWLGGLALLVAFVAIAAVPTLSTQNIDLSADVVNSDLRNDVQVLSGNVRITQGEMSMEAEEATVTGFQSDSSRWTFERSVHIRTSDADLRSDSASAVFSKGRISEAIVKGTPALFEQRNASADSDVRGRAKVIEYDFVKGTVKLNEDVWFSYGGNEFRGNTVVYNVNDERVVVNPGGTNSGGRVNITIRPGTGQIIPGSKTPAPQEPSQPEKKE
jgi:lipopolysaccharide transport protein LptA